MPLRCLRGFGMLRPKGKGANNNILFSATCCLPFSAAPLILCSPAAILAIHASIAQRRRRHRVVDQKSQAIQRSHLLLLTRMRLDAPNHVIAATSPAMTFFRDRLLTALSPFPGYPNLTRIASNNILHKIRNHG